MKRLVFMFLAALSFCTVHAQDIIFTPQWTAQSQFAGYYAAKELGYYDEAGVDVKIVHPTPSNHSYDRLKNGMCNVITMELIQAMQVTAKGENFVNIMQTTQHSTLSVVVRNPEVKVFEDLKERRVGTWKVGFSEIPYMINNDKNLNIDWILFINPVSIFLSGAVDACLAKTYNEKELMLLAGVKPGNIIYFSEHGYDFPEDGVYVTRDFYRKNPEKCRAFAEASRRGWEWVREHRDEAVDISFKYIKADHIPTNRYHQRKMLDGVLEAQIDNPDNTASFKLKKTDFERLEEALIKYGFISRPLDFDKFTGAR